MSGFTDIFTGDSILPSWPAYLALMLTADVLLGWPTEINAGNGYVVAEILEVNAQSANLSIQLSPATEIGEGYSFLVNNVGGNTVTVLDNLGNTLASVASGTVWQLYCADNTTQQGTWRAFQYGAGVSNANAAALAGSGLKAIASTLNDRIFVNAQVVNYALQDTDRASLIEWTGAGGGAFTLPAPATVGSDWFCYIKNAGGASLVVTPAAGSINSAASQTFQVNDSAIVVSDGANYWTIGFGQSLNSSFNFATISLAGLSGTYTLAGSNLNRISYKFIGALAGNITVVTPASVQQYWIDNETTGAYTMTISSSGSGGATVVLPQSSRNIFYCDGLNIVAAVSGQGVVPTFPDGGAGNPSITFTSDTTLGLYKAGTDTLGIASAGTLRGTVNATGNWVLSNASTGTTLTLTGGLSTDTLATSGNATVGGTLGVTGAATLAGTLAVTGTITGGTFNGQTISNVASLTGTLAVAGALTVGAAGSSLVGGVTIGTPAAGNALTVNALTATAAVQFTDGTHTGQLFLGSSVGQEIQFGAFSDHGIGFFTNNAVRCAINNTGNVSIVPPSAGTTLTLQSTNTSVLSLISTGVNLGPQIYFSGNNGNAYFGIDAFSNNVLALGSPAAAPLTLNFLKGGAIGIQIATVTAPTVSDDGGTQQVIGYRGTPVNTQGVSYTLVLSDRGKQVNISATGLTVTVPENVFNAGDVVVVRAATGTLTIAQGTGVTLTWANGSGATTGNRTLTAVGLATLSFSSATTADITGSGLS